MIAMAIAVGMESCSPPGWWQPGAMALLLVDLQQGSCGDALACFRGYCTQIPVAGFTATVESVMASAQ